MRIPVLLLAFAGSTLPLPTTARVVDIVSSPPDPFALGVQGNEGSENFAASAFSEDGRLVAYDSRASNFVPGDDNQKNDVFLKDLATGAVTLVSHRPDGRPGSEDSQEGAISGNGRYVVFTSEAEDLVSGDDNGATDIFLFDRTNGAVERVSRAANGVQGNSDSYAPSVSRDGRYVAFVSDASNLVAGDDNGLEDVFVRDRELGFTLRASLGSGNTQANGLSGAGRIDATGRYVCFESAATNLAPEDTSPILDVFVRDLAAGTTELVSRTPSGGSGNGASSHCAIASGGAVAFQSRASDLAAGDTNGQPDIFVHDPMSGLERIDAGAGGMPGDGPSFDPHVSHDARFVAFSSQSTNLPGPHRAGQLEIYRYDRAADTALRISLDTGGNVPLDASFAPHLSPDGMLVAYVATSDDHVGADTNLARDLIVYDTVAASRVTASAAAIAQPSGGGGTRAAASADGRYVAFVSSAPILAPGMANRLPQVYLRDTVSGALTLVSKNTQGMAGNAASDDVSMSADGRFVAFASTAQDLTPGTQSLVRQVYLYDREAESLQRISNDALGNPGTGPSSQPALSADGRLVAFVTNASNLLPGTTFRIALFDRMSGSLTRGDVAADGTPANGSSGRGRLSFDGRYLAFASAATNLGADANTTSDIFRKDLVTGAVVLVSQSGSEFANGASNEAAISADGRFVAYHSLATNLVAGDTNNTNDVFRTEVESAATVRVSAGGTVSSIGVSLSADGRFVAFHTGSALVPSDTNLQADVYVYDAVNRLLRRSSVGPTGGEFDAGSSFAALAGDGNSLVFDVLPSRVVLPGRYNAPVGADVVKAENTLANVLFVDSFE